jgi:hypothetical protein
MEPAPLAAADLVARLRSTPNHSGDTVCETRLLWEAAAALEAAQARIAELERSAEERDSDMHARIRATYDNAVIESWRTALTKAEAARDAAVAALRWIAEHAIGLSQATEHAKRALVSKGSV